MLSCVTRLVARTGAASTCARATVTAAARHQQRVDLARFRAYVSIMAGAFAVLLGVAASTSQAQVGTVLSQQKITEGEGGFVGPLTSAGAFGAYIAPIGDLDNDGVADFAVSAYRDSNLRGAVWILFMNANGTVKSEQKIQPGWLIDNDAFGQGVAGIGDLDGDGNEDIAVGVSHYFLPGSTGHSLGMIRILFLNSDGTVHHEAEISSNTVAGLGDLLSFASFPTSLAYLGDLDGAGVGNGPILAAGCGSCDIDGVGNAGSVILFSLNSSGVAAVVEAVDKNDLPAAPPISPGAELGSAVASLGDLDGPGGSVHALAVGAMGDEESGVDHGAVFILFLNANGTLASYRKIGEGREGFPDDVFGDVDYFGVSVGALGDLDGPGGSVLTLAVGTSHDDSDSGDGRVDSGSLWLLFLNANGTVQGTQKLHDVDSSFCGPLDAFDYFGAGVAPLGDIDSNGVPDVLVGSYWDMPSQKGAVWRLLLKTTACGNGVLDAGEQCDDGNIVAGDCCSRCCGFEPAAVECRGSAGACDVAETCTGTSGSCPVDAFQAATIECRASTGACDQAEFCTGASAECPADGLTPSGVICRPGTDLCDAAEACTGLSSECPPDELVPAMGVCRPAAGDCDVAEVCDGIGPACPANSFVPASVVCRESAGSCDVAESCTGSDATCPADAVQPSGAVCRASAGLCDVQEVCSGSSNACPGDAKVPGGTLCRAASGVCDVAEACDGASSTCPVDGHQPDGTSCSDGNACTAGDVCSAGVCEGIGAPCGRCTGSGNACTTPADCAPGEGCCGNAVEDPFEQCDDGNLDDYDCCSSVCQTEPATICDPIPDLCDGVVPPHLISNPTIKRPALKDRSRPADLIFDQWKTTGEFELPDLQDMDPETEQVDFVLSQNDGANNSVELYHATLAPGACTNGVCFIARRNPLGYARSWRFSRARSLPDIVDAAGWRKGSFTRSGTTKIRFSLSGSDAAIERPLLSSGVRRIRQTIKIGDDCITRQLDCQRNASETSLKCVHASCGNGVVSPGEQCGEATLPACGGSKVCDTCKCVNP